jgi:hypothetical protein
MTQEGRSLEQIRQEVQVGLEVLNQFLPEEPPETDDYSTSKTSERMPKEPSHQMFYCCEYTNQLLRTNLLTGEQSWHQVPGYIFIEHCC